MKVDFTENGALVVAAENHTERVALKHWVAGFKPDTSPENTSAISFDMEGYQNNTSTVTVDH